MISPSRLSAGKYRFVGRGLVLFSSDHCSLDFIWKWNRALSIGIAL
jgi:hypothetical protein